MSENLNVFDAVKKKDLFMEVREENRKKFIDNIKRYFPFLLKPLLRLEKDYFISYISDIWAFVIDCDKSFIETMNKNYEMMKDYVYKIETKDVKVLCVNLSGIKNHEEREGELKASFDISYKESNLFPNGFKFKYTNYGGISILASDKVQMRRAWKHKTLKYDMRLNDIVKESSEKNRALFLLFKYMFEERKADSLMLKDVINDMEKSITSINAPIPISLLFETFNKKMLFETKYPSKIFGKATNKLSIYENYVRHFLSQKLKEEEFKKIDIHIAEVLNSNPTLSQKAFTTNFLKAFLSEFLKIRIFGKSVLEREQKQLLDDYLRMRENLNVLYNLNMRSFKRLREEHDRLVHLQNARRYDEKEFKLKRNNPYPKFKCPKGMRFLSNPKEIADEGGYQRNCVASYINSVANGHCGIYSLIMNEKRYTIRLRMIDKQYVLDEIKGFANSYAEAEVVDYIEKAIDENNFIDF